MLFFMRSPCRLNACARVHELCLFHVGLVVKSCSGFLPLGLDPACSPSFGTKAVIFLTSLGKVIMVFPGLEELMPCFCPNGLILVSS